MVEELIITDEFIMSKILLIRNQKVMIDSDLASLYGVTTKRLNEQVKRNVKRFPNNFMFQLTETEKKYVVANCDHLKKLKFSSTLPYVFTEHGTMMLGNVLTSDRAIEFSIKIVEAFIKSLLCFKVKSLCSTASLLVRCEKTDLTNMVLFSCNNSAIVSTSSTSNPNLFIPVFSFI